MPEPPVLQLSGTVSPCDIGPLCERACRMLEGGELLICDVEGLHADAVAVEALARLQLAARRHGCCLKLCRPSGELVDLIDLMGLKDVLPVLDAGAGG